MAHSISRLDLRLNASRCQDRCRQLQQHFGILLPLSGKRTVLGELRNVSEVGLTRVIGRYADSRYPRRIISGGDKRIWRRMTKRLRLSSAPGEDGDWDGYRVSRFGFRPRAVRLVERAHARVGLVRRRSLPRSFLSPFALFISRFRRRSILKKAHLSRSPRSPENHDYCPTLSSPIFSVSSHIFVPCHSTPST